MVSMDSAVTTVANAKIYFEKNVSATWLGKGAEDLGLTGDVKMEDFYQVASGYSLGSDQLKSKREKSKGPEIKETERRVGNVITFCSPKSVSVAFAAGVEGIKEAHDEAVLAIASIIEDHYISYRTPEGNKLAGNIVAAKIDHATNWAQYPLLHSHLFIINMTQDNEGVWQENYPHEMYEDLESFGLLFRDAEIKALGKKGFEIEYIDKDQHLYEIKR